MKHGYHIADISYLMPWYSRHQNDLRTRFIRYLLQDYYCRYMLYTIIVHGEYLIILYFICVEKYDLAESTFGYWSRKAQQLPSKKVCNIFKLKLFDLKKLNYLCIVRIFLGPNNYCR